MTEEDSCAIAEKWIDALQHGLRLQDRRIRTEHGRIEGPSRARMRNNRPYTSVQIWVDAEEHDSEREVVASLFHEMAHVLHEPFDRVFDVAVEHIDDPATEAALEAMYDEACERLVAHLEHILYNGLRSNALEFCLMAQRAARRDTEDAWLQVSPETTVSNE